MKYEVIVNYVRNLTLTYHTLSIISMYMFRDPISFW